MLIQVDPAIVTLIRQPRLTAHDQTTTEAEIDRLATERNCTHQRAAQLIHLTAYSEVR